MPITWLDQMPIASADAAPTSQSHAGARAQDADPARQVERDVGRERADGQAEQEHQHRRHCRFRPRVDRQIGRHAPLRP